MEVKKTQEEKKSKDRPVALGSATLIEEKLNEALCHLDEQDNNIGESYRQLMRAAEAGDMAREVLLDLRIITYQLKHKLEKAVKKIDEFEELISETYLYENHEIVGDLIDEFKQLITEAV